MHTFSIRLDDDNLKKLDSAKGDKPRAEYVREVLIEHLTHLNEPMAHHQEPHENRKEPPNELIKTLQEEVAYLRSKLDDANKRIDDALKLLHQEQILHLHAQRQLTAPEKKWWKFWK